jgi:hypothetical protein
MSFPKPFLLQIIQKCSENSLEKKSLDIFPVIEEVEWRTMREVIIRLDGKICSYMQVETTAARPVVELRAWRYISQHVPKGRCLREIRYISPRLIEITTQEA